MISRERMNIAETETSNPPTDGFAVSASGRTGRGEANIPALNSHFLLLTYAFGALSRFLSEEFRVMSRARSLNE